jgi:hypothetical protein
MARILLWALSMNSTHIFRGVALLVVVLALIYRPPHRRAPVRTEPGWEEAGPVVTERQRARGHTVSRSVGGSTSETVRLRPIHSSLSHFQFAEAERHCRERLTRRGLEPSERGWTQYYLAESLWAQGKAGEAKAAYELFLREQPAHRAAENARAALEFLAHLDENRQIIAQRESER